MLEAMPIILPQPQLLEITGADAVTFAQAQFSSDVLALANAQWQWSTWLSPQGRVRAFFHLLRDDATHLRLLLRGGDAETLRAALARFVFRAKVQLQVVADAQLSAMRNADEIAAPASAVPHANEILASNHASVIALPGEAPRWLQLRDSSVASNVVSISADVIEHWRLDDIRAGLPELAPTMHEQLLPQWLGLDRLGVVSVRKGCYPGQEIMARLHFKGGNKRGLYLLHLPADLCLQPATSLCGEDGAIAGQVVQCAHDENGGTLALASLSDAAATGTLCSNDPTVEGITVLKRFD